MRILLVSGALLLGALPLRTSDNDLACPPLTPAPDIPWLVAIPPRAQLPTLEQAGQQGAVVILDEHVQNGDSGFYTLMVMLASARAEEIFGSVDLSAASGGPLVIRARVQSPDGTVTELPGRDIHCSVRRVSRAGGKTGRKQGAAPHRYIFNFPGLQRGSVVQYQVFVPRDFDLGYSANTDSIPYTRRFLYLGYQHALDPVSHWSEDYSDDPRLYYPALVIREITPIRAQDARPEPLVLAEGVEIRDVKDDKQGRHFRQMTGARPALHGEPHAPSIYALSPKLSQCGETPPIPADYSRYLPFTGREELWYHWELFAAPILHRIRANPAALIRFYELAQLSATAEQKAFAIALNRYLRDEVKRDSGDLRQVGGMQSVLQVIAVKKSGYPVEKLMAFATLLLSRGLTPSLVLSHRRDHGPAEIGCGGAGFWYDHYLISVEIDGRQHYFDPLHPVASGSMPHVLRGADALRITAGKPPEWIKLPAADADENRTAAELRLAPAPGAALSGTVTLEITGYEAQRIRHELFGSTPAEIQQYLHMRLKSMSLEGTTLAELRAENLADPDRPLRIAARLVIPDAIVSLRTSRRLRMMPFRAAPDPGQFAAEKRRYDIDFRQPRRYLETLVIESPEGAALQPPPDVALAAAGAAYRLQSTVLENRVEIRRELTLPETIPNDQYAPFLALLRKTN